MDPSRLPEIVLGVLREQTPVFPGPLRLDTPIGTDGLGIDSIGLLKIILELERRTGILLRNESLTAEALATPGAIIQLLARTGLS